MATINEMFACLNLMARKKVKNGSEVEVEVYFPMIRNARKMMK